MQKILEGETDRYEYAPSTNVGLAESDPDYEPPPGKPDPEPVKEPPGGPGRDVPEPRPIDDPRPPKPKKKVLTSRRPSGTSVRRRDHSSP